MANIVESIIDGVATIIAALSTGLKQTMLSYCDIQTADSPTVLVAHDGSLLSVLKLEGVTSLIGREEFARIHNGLQQSLGALMSKPGYSIQVFFSYNKDRVLSEIEHIYKPGRQTAKRLGLKLDDLFKEQSDYIGRYTAHEEVYLVLWTRVTSLTGEQQKRALKDKAKFLNDNKVPPFQYTQNVLAAVPDLRDSHDSFVRSVVSDMRTLGVVAKLCEVHQAVRAMRMSVDPEFTDRHWAPVLPGDQIKVKKAKHYRGDISDVLWPSLTHQLMPRDGFVHDQRTVQIGDRLYSSIFIDLFPKQVQSFSQLFGRTIQTAVPWRMSFLIDSNGMGALKFKRIFSSLLSFSSEQNRLINDAVNLLSYVDLNTDDSIVKVRVAISTWAPEGDMRLLRTRISQIARAVQSWGSCDVSEVCGDPFEGVVSSMLGIADNNVGTTSVAPLSDILTMLPLYRPSSPWQKGALLFRSPDGKPWPYQPGSSEQTTWIDLIYARPGSGKSVLSNAINLALCLSGGIQRLPRISVIDIGPSSSGLISLLKEALPDEQKHFAAYHRLQMTPDYAINPFDTQLGCRLPLPQERSFLVNFITLLATPIGSDAPYDGMADMVGLIVDEAYKISSDDNMPNVYASGVEEMIDAVLDEIGFVADQHTTWWEVTDALFAAGFKHHAMLSQRNAMPLIGDTTSIVRSSAVEDLYGDVKSPTGEGLINAFTRMISAAIREYPVLSQVTQFDIGEAKIVSLDLDEVAKGGGEAADRQTAVMYMLARYVLARDFYLNEESLHTMRDHYRSYHAKRISEIREDQKRLVLDEFHRTSKAKAVREQVITDMREGRKWNVEIALISQSLEDFDALMVEFGTSIFIMDAGPEQAIAKTRKVFGLSETAVNALRSRVHGPREGGGTFLAQFSTKQGSNTQLLTLTLGPVELWAFSTTAEDAEIRNRLYAKIGPVEARRVLANIFPGGSAKKAIEDRLNSVKVSNGLIDDEAKQSVLDEIVQAILNAYAENPAVKTLPD